MHDLFAVAYFVINNVISGKTSLGSGGSMLEQVSAVCRFQFSVGQNLVIVMNSSLSSSSFIVICY